MEYTIKFSWDEEACVWIATSEDIHGLVLESGSLDALMEKVKYAVPELLELNHKAKVKKLHFLAEREFDYTKWQSTYFGKMEPEEFNEAAARYAKEHPYTGNAKVIL